MNKFTNHPLTDFNKPQNAELMIKAIKHVEAQLGKQYPIIIGGKKIYTDQKIKSINPSDKLQTVGLAQKADAELANKAIDDACHAFETWKRVPFEKRAELLFKASEIMKKRQFELAAWMIFEIGKSWNESDGDVAEAIDFLEFYAREAIRISKGHGVTAYPGEKNESFYIPLGVGSAIPPWNFPLAILVGITVSGIVCGNTMILKPASDTPIIAAKFMEIMEEAGLPDGVINFLTGSGAEIGDIIVKSPKIRFINFTGSKEVGLHIVEEAAKVSPSQKWIKRVVAEMGGKDAIIVDSSADIDAAVDGVLKSAFGFQGQKCSACSRAIVDKKVYDQFLEGILGKVKAITVGDPRDHKNYMGPVSSMSAFKKIMGYIEKGKFEGRLIAGGTGDDSKGFFIAPTIIADVKPDAIIAQEEIFGPVLAVIKSNDFEDALNIANSTDYGLTGAVFTNDEKKIEKARNEFFVGNLYINRKCTGALVDVQPFGGYNMSGTCSKAGGRDYLLQFVQGKSFCRKL